MNKLRPLPIYTLHDTDFIVDIERQVLREAQRPNNEISFTSNMQDKGDHYLLHYDFVEKTCNPAVLDPLTFITVKVPPLLKLDPEGMSEKYGIPVSQLDGKTDFGVIVDQELLAQRLKGALPRINIAGEEFIIDLRLRELRHAKNFHPVLSLRSFGVTGDGKYFQAFYQPLMRQTVEIDPKLTEFPDGVVRIRFPNELGLDPVAVARQYDLDEKEILRRHPLQKELKAEVIPLSETHIPALIQRNREQLRREHEEIARRIRPKHRPHF
jgi:hypothetical protein